MTYTIGTSVICMDHINFADHVRMAVDVGVDYLHLDIMDGHFVPRYGLYPEIVKRILELESGLSLDLHLMVSDPEFALGQFAPYLPEIDYVNFHYEAAAANVFRVFDKIRELGSLPGLAMNLSTDPSTIYQIMTTGEVESVCVMGIHPGVLKQTARPHAAITRMSEISCLLPRHKPTFRQVDGGVQLNNTIRQLYVEGTNNFVCGTSTLYKGIDVSRMTMLQQADKMKENLTKMRSLIAGVEDE